MHASVLKCFKIEDTESKTPFAVKFIKEYDEEKLMAHRNEFKMMESMNHPNIVKALDYFYNP
jgi:serine/threonine protein kinase